MTLFEILMAVILLSIITLSSSQSISHWKTMTDLTTHQATIGQLLGESRWIALATDTPTGIQLTSSQCQFTNTDISAYPLPSSLTASISNSQGMGFNGLGSTSKAATLTLANGSATSQITLAVGFGMLRLR